MKHYQPIVLLLLLYSCADQKTASPKTDAKATQHNIVVPEFQVLIDAAAVEGSILIYDLEADSYYSNDFDWTETGKLPASTYKIINSIIALETGVVANESTLFKWNRQPRSLKVWEQDLKALKRPFISLVCLVTKRSQEKLE